ncbi:hypothetical protein MTO96_031621 [Rhipicephalus appendiculatus]
MFEALPNPPLTADTVAASTQECTVLKEVYAAIQEGKVQKLKAEPLTEVLAPRECRRLRLAPCTANDLVATYIPVGASGCQQTHQCHGWHFVFPSLLDCQNACFGERYLCLRGTAGVAKKAFCLD